MRHSLAATTASLLLIGGLSLGAVQAQEAKPGLLSPNELTQMQAALERLSRQPASTAQVKAFLQQHRFDCSAGAEGNSASHTTRRRLSCEVGNAASEDPSPWPELILGLSRGHIVAALMPEAGTAPPLWACRPTKDAEARLCFTPRATATDKRRWTADWTRLLNAAD